MTHEPLPQTPDELPPPRGTLFVLVVYVAILAGMWGAIYLRLLER